MKRFLKKLTVTAVLVSVIMSLVGCSLWHTPVKSDKDPKKIVQDTKRTEEIKKEKGVVNGQVYMKNNVVTATLAFKDDVSEKDAKEIINKYVEALKKEYKGTKINVQAVQKGKNIANIDIDK